MRTFVLQPGNSDIELALIREEAEFLKHRYDTNIISASIEDILEKRIEFDVSLATPVGTLEFVQAFLLSYHGIDHMTPIEIPEILRYQVFLCRKYMIVPKSEIPRTGRWFVKDVSTLKAFSALATWDDVDMAMLNDNSMFQVSEPLDIESEWRVYVHKDRIVGTAMYDCDKTAFLHTIDMSKFSLAIEQYQQDPKMPTAYTMDFAVTRKGDTALLEIHPWVSVGLYATVYMDDLLDCYADGFRWYVELVIIDGQRRTANRLVETIVGKEV